MKFGWMTYADYGPYAWDLIRRGVNIMNKYNYNSVWQGDQRLLTTWTGRLDTLATLPAIAMLTDKMTIGTNILQAPFYHPLFLAEFFASLDHISKGKVILGLGTGYRPEMFEAYEVPRNEMFSRLEETVEIIRRLWTEPSVTFSGRHFHFKDVSLKLKPLQKPCPPIWVGASKKPGFRRAARIGDGCAFAGAVSLPRLKGYLKGYKKALEDAGKDLEKIEIARSINGCIAKNRDIARMAAEEFFLEKLKDYGRRVGSEVYLQLQEEGRTWKDLTVEDIKGAVIGTPEDAIEYIEEMRKLGFNHIIFRLAWGNITREQSVIDAIELIGKRVIPYFEEDS